MSIRPVTEYPMLPQPGRATPAGLAQHQGFMVAALVRHFGELGFAINRLIKRTRFGELADRPDAGEADRFFLATDQSPVELYYDDGSQWHLIASQVGKDIGDVPQYEDDGSGNPVLDHPNMPLVGGDAVVESGSNSNGEYVRFSNGIQFCQIKTLTLSQHAAAGCKATWTFPASFVDTGYSANATQTGPSDSTAPLSSAADASPNTEQMSNTMLGSYTASSVEIEIQRLAGQTDFASGDQMYVDATAMGRWK